MKEKSIYSFSAQTLSGEEKPLSEYEGQVVLIVNTASKCGLAPQLKELEALYEKYRDKGFVVLGFPCNQFAGQEPLSNQEMAQTCLHNYGVTFPMFSKIEVNGPNTHPLYLFLKKEKRGFLFSSIKWNFTKFLIDRKGQPIKRYAPTTAPMKIAKDIEKALKER